MKFWIWAMITASVVMLYGCGGSGGGGGGSSSSSNWDEMVWDQDNWG